MLDDLAQNADLALEQAPGCAREQVRNALGARVRAVRAAERVVYVDVGEVGQRARKRWIVARLARLEADVLEHQQLAGRELLAQLFDGAADDARRERHPGVGQLAQAGDDRCHREALVALSARPSQVRDDHQAPAARP